MPYAGHFAAKLDAGNHTEAVTIAAQRGWVEIGDWGLGIALSF
jgi:hypothetical protein